MARSGIDLSHIKASVRPQDDLFVHVNGQWLDTFEIPPDRGSDGAFRELRDRSEEQVKAIIEELAASPQGSIPTDVEQGSAHQAGLIAALYASFMDTDRIEALGLEPLRPDLEMVAGAASPEALAQVVARLGRAGVGGVFGSYVDTDPGDPSRYVINLYQGGIGLPDEAYYRDEQYAKVRQAYREHLARMAGLVRQHLADTDATDTDATDADTDTAADAEGRLGPIVTTDPAKTAELVYALEKRLAAAHWDVVKTRDATATYNPMNFAQLRDMAPGFPWEEWTLTTGGTPETWDALVVGQPDYFKALAEAWRDVPMETWQLWAAIRVIASRASYLNDTMVQANFDFVGRVLQGTEQIRDRWKRGVSLVEGVLGEAVGQIYTARHFPPENKARMEHLVANLVEAYRRSITAQDWLGDQTKAKALAKLDAFTPKIGYPDKWRDYAALRLDADDLLGNVRAATAFETDRELAKIGQPVDRAEWFMTPQTVNAYYNPGMNEVVFPAAILQPPFFDMGADDAANYGGIGAVIGHEIGHGFDDQGSKYDGEGRLQDWWTAADREAFEHRTKALISQYDAYALDLPDGPMHVNGALTVGENIGDLGGLAIAWLAYNIALDAAEPPVLDGMTAAQRFFFGWAGCWRDKVRPQEATLRLSVDPHSPDQFRCNGVVRNLDAFYEAFNVTPGDALYLPPEKRVSIW